MRQQKSRLLLLDENNGEKKRYSVKNRKWKRPKKRSLVVNKSVQNKGRKSLAGRLNDG